MALKMIASPGKYIQGAGALEVLGRYAGNCGDKAFVIASNSAMKVTKVAVEASFESQKLPFVNALFKGECSKVEIERLKGIATDAGCTVIVGIGGGKTLDAAKALAYYMGVQVVVVPTIASTDAPCSALSVLYTEDGVFDEYLILPTNPTVVLMDTDIVAKAPVRLLVAGIGDALATYFEARATMRSQSTTMAGGLPTEGAFALAELCYNLLLSEGLKAKIAVENKLSNKALEKIVEANTYLSGIGFESGGLAAAHAIHNGLTTLEACHHLYHGEKVAFGTLVQLVLENAPLEEIQKIVKFCRTMGLPTTLKDMGAEGASEVALRRVAEAATVPGETIHNMPFKVTADDVYAAIVTADGLGCLFA